MEIRTIRVYQLQALVTGGMDTTATIEDIIDHLLETKTNTCPQCARTGVIDADFDSVNDTECPTCGGDGYTVDAYEVDRPNSTITYKPVS